MRRAVNWLLILPFAGCQLIIAVDTPQCEQDQDCVGLLGRDYICSEDRICLKEQISEPDASDSGEEQDASTSTLPDRWKCLHEPFEKMPPDASKTVTIRFNVLDFTAVNVPEGLTAKACNPSDISCENPIVDDVEPGEDGFLEFELPHGFEGFFELNAPSIVPALSYSNRPFYRDLTFSGPSVVTPATLVDISERGDTDPDFNLGVAVLELFDCDGEPADGVHLEKNDEYGEHAFYFDGALPDRELESTTVSSALAMLGGKPRAVGGFNNIEPGYITFEATLVDTGDLLEESTVQVRSGYITYLSMYAGY